MGTFTRLPGEEPRYSRHHRRTLHARVTISTSQIEDLEIAVNDASKLWLGTEVAVKDGVSTVDLSYGPVLGAYRADVVRFLDSRNIEAIDITIIGTTHADEGCTNRDCVEENK